MKLSNSYSELPDHFYARIRTDPAPEPRLLAWNGALAAHLGLEALGQDAERLAAIFSGSQPLPGGRSIALAYAGHQFGNFVPQLGDGRAALLAEVISPVDGRCYDIQLKGSGQTPFSRSGDGKSPLGPVIREYLLSETMHRLGVPTTRSLAAVATGEPVFREAVEPGGVLTRVAASHIRVGTFQLFAARRDVAALQTLVDYAIQRHYPDAASAEQPAAAFFSAVVTGQARLVAHWMAVGFIHGVMNTDNCAISGETLDYGPCAFLAECLMLIEENRERYETLLGGFQAAFEEHYFRLMSRKLGLSPPDAANRDLVTAWLQQLQEGKLDYTQSFRQLASQLDAGGPPRFGDFETRWLQRIDRQPGGRERAAGIMTSANPRFIPRNHQVERAIRAAYEEDLRPFEELRQVLSAPFDPHPGLEHYAEPPGENERVLATFCGT